jgi:ATP-dependent DNA helicase RecG
LLTDAELVLLLASRESGRVERKESAQLDAAKETACAFSNDLPNSREPGVIFIGIRDDGSCANIRITDELLRKIGEIRADGTLLPAPVVEIEERVLNGCALVVVQVYPHSAPPVRFRGRVYVRVGPRNQVASPEEERLLSERRRGRDLPFDHRPLIGSVRGDIDDFRFREVYLPSAIGADVIAQNERTDDDRLISLRLLDPSGIPTAGGLLIIGRDPERFIPGAYVQYVRFDGTELTSGIVDEKRISGTLDEQLSATDDMIKLNIRTGVDLVSSDRETRFADYSVAALQQLIRNAIMHRNYEDSYAPIRVNWFSDRVEIQNPGGLFGQVNSSNFGHVTDYRNPLVAEGMKNYGYVQRFGVGVQLARKLLRENGNPEPEFQFSDRATAVIVRAV